MVMLTSWVLVVLLLRESGVGGAHSACDESPLGAPREGALGSARAFPWLGVLRVHLHQDATLKVALTGLILVKQSYAIANADDITRIPKRIFQEDSRAMFLPSARAPWFCRPRDYLTHPEYELDTLSSLALVELDKASDFSFPMKPVCWPPDSYNVSRDLFAVGYTDENEQLEKMIYKLQYVDRQLCKEFYDRAGLTSDRIAPLRYECGFAYNNKDSCVWENGMALVSNTSGHWVLLGISLQGPGCSAPARFLSFAHYRSWVESATNVQQIDGALNYRKSAFGEGFKSPAPTVEYIPAHELLRSGAGAPGTRHLYPVQFEQEPFFVKRVSATEIYVRPSKYRYGDCREPGIRLIYADTTKVAARDSSGTVRYKMVLHDSMFTNYTCITIKLIATGLYPAYLWYDTLLTDTSLVPETPEEIIKINPFHHLTKLLEPGPKDHLVAAPIQSSGQNSSHYNVNLFLKMRFDGTCKLDIRFYGPPVEITH